MLLDDIERVETQMKRFWQGREIKPVVVRRFTKDVATWYKHPAGRPAHAPKHVHHLEQSKFGWQLPLGNNAFLVEAALRDSLKLIRDVVGWVRERQRPFDGKTLKRNLESIVARSVADGRGYRRKTGYPVSSGHMHFGVQAIDVDTFIERLLFHTKLERILIE